MPDHLSAFAAALASGSIRVVDLTTGILDSRVFLWKRARTLVSRELKNTVRHLIQLLYT